MLTKEEQKTLLSIARHTIEQYLKGSDIDRIKNEAPERFPITGIMREKRGGFVTLRKDGDLRGCIGYIEAIRPLYITVIENAANAAFSDFRFPSVKEDEVASISIEISVLSPVEPLKDIETIEVGRDGLIVKKGFRQGLLLPQVATEYGWDKYQFLSHTCMKAGLPHDEWRTDDIELSRFSSFVFGEGMLA